MTVKASLKVQLTAEDVLVAESEDPELWRKVLSAIQRSGNAPEDLLHHERSDSLEEILPSGAKEKSERGLKDFADEVGVTEEEIEGACGPREQAPYLQLDEHYWEALKQKTPARGPNAVSPLALTGTMLCLWFKHAGVAGNPTVGQCQAVLGTIKLRDANAMRSVKNCEWLQIRGNGVIINPTQRSKAIRIVKAYCLKKSPIELEGK
jgi:hypothetical protein